MNEFLPQLETMMLPIKDSCKIRKLKKNKLLNILVKKKILNKQKVHKLKDNE